MITIADLILSVAGSRVNESCSFIIAQGFQEFFLFFLRIHLLVSIHKSHETK